MNSKKHYIILSTVMTAIILTAVIVLAGMYYLDKTSKELSKTAKKYETKNELVVTLWDTVRGRTISLQYMLVEDDAFKRDELYIKHLELGAKFIHAHEQIMNMELSDEETTLIDNLNGTIRLAAEAQNQLIAMSLNNKLEDALEIMNTSEYKEIRAQFTNQFEGILAYYRAKTQSAVNDVNTVVLKNINFILLLTAFVLVLSATIGFFMTRRIVAAENQLCDEIARHVETQGALEIYRQHLEAEVQKEVEKLKTIEEARNKSQELAYAMGQILEDSLNEIYILDANTLKFIQVNKAARDNTGYSMEELKKLTPIDLSRALSMDDFKELIKPLLNGSEEIIHFTGKLDRKNGTSYPIEIHLQLSMMEYSPVIVAMVLDITERMQIEAGLLHKTSELEITENELEYQKKALDEHAIVCLLDKNECLESVNQKFIELSGFTQDELIGGNVCIGTEADQPEEFFEEMSSTIQRGEVWHGVMSYRRADGTPYWTKTSITPFLDTKGNIEKFISISTDFTAQKLAEQELINKTLELEEAHSELEATHSQALHSEKLASVGQLAAGIAHEINTPIQFVGDNTRFLQEAFEDLTDLISTFQEQSTAVMAGNATPAMAEKARQKCDEVDLEYLTEEVPNAISQSLEGVERVTRIVRSMKDFSHPDPITRKPSISIMRLKVLPRSAKTSGSMMPS